MVTIAGKKRRPLTGLVMVGEGQGDGQGLCRYTGGICQRGDQVGAFWVKKATWWGQGDMENTGAGRNGGRAGPAGRSAGAVPRQGLQDRG